MTYLFLLLSSPSAFAEDACDAVLAASLREVRADTQRLLDQFAARDAFCKSPVPTRNGALGARLDGSVLRLAGTGALTKDSLGLLCGDQPLEGLDARKLSTLARELAPATAEAWSRCKERAEKSTLLELRPTDPVPGRIGLTLSYKGAPGSATTLDVADADGFALCTGPLAAAATQTIAQGGKVSISSRDSEGSRLAVCRRTTEARTLTCGRRTYAWDYRPPASFIIGSSPSNEFHALVLPATIALACESDPT